MGEFPSFEQRLLDCGVPREIAAEIAAEVPRSKDAFRASRGHFFIGLLIGIPLAMLLTPLVYLAAVWLWGEVRPCGAGIFRSAHALAFLQFNAAIFCGHLIVRIWLRTAPHKARMQYVAVHLLRLYRSGFGPIMMKRYVAEAPERATAGGYFNYVWRWWTVRQVGMLIATQAVILAALL